MENEKFVPTGTMKQRIRDDSDIAIPIALLEIRESLDRLINVRIETNETLIVMLNDILARFETKEQMPEINKSYETTKEAVEKFRFRRQEQEPGEIAMIKKLIVQHFGQPITKAEIFDKFDALPAWAVKNLSKIIKCRPYQVPDLVADFLQIEEPQAGEIAETEKI